jgi:hypothetical protein
MAASLLVRLLMTPWGNWVVQRSQVIQVQIKQTANMSLFINSVGTALCSTSSMTYRHPGQCQVGQIMVLPTATDLNKHRSV